MKGLRAGTAACIAADEKPHTEAMKTKALEASCSKLATVTDRRYRAEHAPAHALGIAVHGYAGVLHHGMHGETPPVARQRGRAPGGGFSDVHEIRPPIRPKLPRLQGLVRVKVPVLNWDQPGFHV
jgi:hypothetical protein